MKLILLLFFPLLSFAQSDLSLSPFLRTYPSTGGGLDIKTGYSRTLWAAPDKIWHGMVRAGGHISSSVVINEYSYDLTLYPVSFLGLGMAKTHIKSDYDQFTYYDCEEVRCKGLIDRDIVFGKLALAYGKYFSLFNYKVSTDTYSDEDPGKVAEYSYGILGREGSEKHVKRSYLLGLRDDKGFWAYILDTVHFNKSGQEYMMNLLGRQKQFGKWSLLMGAGMFQSSHVKPAPILLLKVNYIVSPSLAKF